MPPSKQVFTQHLRIAEILYLFMIAFSFHLLLISRTGEARTVWEVLHPFFIPTLFITTFLLLTILFMSEKLSYKLMFVIAQSILIHSFFSIIFPAGDLSGQQMVLGRIRLVYDNAVFYGWTPWPMDFLSQVYEWFNGITFQAALSVVFARMLSIDLLWVHLFLLPVLWGTFIPIAAFLVTKALGGNENVAVLSSLIISAFPYATYFGAISVPNSLAFIFFFYSLYFMLKNLDSNDSKNKNRMLAFSFLSLLAHHLTAIMSLSFLIIVQAFKSYRGEKKPLSVDAKVSLFTSFILSSVLLPLSLIYFRFLRPIAGTVFTLEKFFEKPIEELVGLFLLGDLTYASDPKTILLFIIGPAIALLWMLYLLYNLKMNSDTQSRTPILFISMVFLMILIDYRILYLFMDKLPINAERLWVFQDFIAAPFVALAIYGVFTSLKRCLKAHRVSTTSTVNLKQLSKGSFLRVLSLMLTLNFLIPMLLAGWITVSLNVAYPQMAPLQTTWYELEAAKYIEQNTKEKYVVIGDIWTIYAGEVIVGVNNPRAYYFLEFNKTGYDLFSKMLIDPSPQVMIEAMNVNNATVVYFIVGEPRLGTEEFNRVISQARVNGLEVFGVFGEGKLYAFRYEKLD